MSSSQASYTSTSYSNDGSNSPSSGSGPAGMERKWDWIFKALYSISRLRQSSILLSIPDTVLFVGGAPVKWVGTVADGRVGRRVMARENAYRSQSGIGAGRLSNVSLFVLFSECDFVRNLWVGCDAFGAFFMLLDLRAKANFTVTSPLGFRI